MSQGLVFNLDPDPASRANLSEAVKSPELEVREFGDADAAIEAVRQRTPQVVIVAPQVGQETGTDVCARISAVCEVPTLLRVPGDRVPSNAVNATAVLPECAPAPVVRSMVDCMLRLSAGHRERAELRSDLDHLQQEFQICITRTAHDVTEAIRGMTTLSEMLHANGLERLSGAEGKYVEHVMESVGRARTLLRYLSAYVQASREPVSAHRNVDLRGVVMAAEAQHRDEIERSGATLRIDDLPVVRGNPARLQQLLGCLLSNSLKFRDPERPLQIVIQSEPDGHDRWAISVSDNGTGLDSQHQESIFSPFHRLHGKEIPGTGMGLALARAIVEAHGGTITVKSAPGQGATFRFSLPAAS